MGTGTVSIKFFTKLVITGAILIMVSGMGLWVLDQDKNRDDVVITVSWTGLKPDHITYSYPGGSQTLPAKAINGDTSSGSWHEYLPYHPGGKYEVLASNVNSNGHPVRVDLSCILVLPHKEPSRDYISTIGDIGCRSQ